MSSIFRGSVTPPGPIRCHQPQSGSSCYRCHWLSFFVINQPPAGLIQRPWCTSCGHQPLTQAPVILDMLSKAGLSPPALVSEHRNSEQLLCYSWTLRGDHPIPIFTSTATPSLYQGSSMKVPLLIVTPGPFLPGAFFPCYAEDRSLVCDLTWGSCPCQSDPPCIPRPQLTNANKRGGA